MDESVERLLAGLKKRKITASYLEDRKAAREKLLELIPDQCSVGIGGSITIEQLELEDALGEKGCSVYWHWRVPAEKIKETRRQAGVADVYLSSTNAVTEDGVLINIDGFGNRVASMVFGPQKVIIVAGINKIVGDVHEGLVRIKRDACTQNARRLQRKTPCASGECTDCSSPERMCNVTTIIEGKPNGVEMVVLLVGKSLGY
ncbi:MAG: lactate utilization protein [Bacillota bacterium]|nr:lactate utilization protein [Bacillota bacterium]MDW7682673.1 lactate utilization protein [Bacillota bacterium]